MPNDPYLDASVVWRIKHHNIDFQEADHQTQVKHIQEAGLATEVHRLMSAGKEADVYLCSYRGSPLAVKVYRLYRTSHRGGRPIKLESAGRLAAHEFDMLLQAWKGGAPVPTPARRVENMLSMRYLGDECPAPRLHDVHLDWPQRCLEDVISGIEVLARAGVVHTDLSAFNVLWYEDRPWFIDLSEALRVDRFGYSAWRRLEAAEKALTHGLSALANHFGRYDMTIDVPSIVSRIIAELDINEVLIHDR